MLPVCTLACGVMSIVTTGIYTLSLCVQLGYFVYKGGTLQ